jgi:uncharacterized membrane protein YjfL (UPF0719 family)
LGRSWSHLWLKCAIAGQHIPACFALLFFAGMWIFSYVLFRVTFFITGFLTPESELNELRKNNIEIALVHAIIILVLSFVLAPAITRVAYHFVPYPTLPF